jgi:hypothetical protein
MPPTLTTLRVGEIMRATARVVDNLGEPIEASSPGWSDFAGDVVGLVPVVNPYQVLVSGEAPGADTLTFAAQDSFDNEVSEIVPVVVLDASRLDLRPSAPVNCRLTRTKDRLLVYLDVEPADPSFTLTVVPVDQRANERGTMPAYALSDGPDLSSQHGRVLLNGGPTSSDDLTVNVAATLRGEEVISATAVTAATGATITGTLALTIVTASDATITAVPEA